MDVHNVAAAQTKQGQHPGPRINRRLARRIRHQVTLGGLSVAGVAIIAQSFTAGRIESISAATAYAGLFMLAATLMIGPLNVILRQPNPVSSDLRRDIGIWAAILGLLHTALALWPGIRGGLGRVFALSPQQLRLGSLGLANDAGLVGSCLLALLMLLSNDRSLRLLGRARWKGAQRASYVLFAVVLLHTLLYQRLAQPGQLYVILFAVAAVAVPGLQIQGWIESRRMRFERSEAASKRPS